jgi:hypothetical protein
MCHHTTIHKAAHLSPIGLIGPVRTGPYFLALANILHPSAVGARGCSGHQLLKTQNRSKFLLSNFLKSAFSEVRSKWLRSATVLSVLLAALFVFDPVLVPEFGAPTSGGPPYDVYEITPTKAFGFPTDGESFTPTRWRFGRDRE